MSEQLTIIPKRDPDTLIKEAIVTYQPIASYCLFSGGHDSTVLAHRCRDRYGSLMHIDTGTAVPGVREYVDEFAAWLDKPLVVYEAGVRYCRLGGYDKHGNRAGGPVELGNPLCSTCEFRLFEEELADAA